jgi:hypothetical protein
LFLWWAVWLSAFCAPVLADRARLTVPATAAAWDVRLNPQAAFGVGGGTPPAASQQLKLVEGQKIRITASGTTKTFRGGPDLGPEGQANYIADDYPGGSGTFFPSKYVDPDTYPAHLNELIGAFVDAKGQLAAPPFVVGREWKGKVPNGAVSVQFGINDDVLKDNEGQLSVEIETNAVFPDSDLARPAKAPLPPPVILPPYPATPPTPIHVRPKYNPIISDGSLYSADPAPLVANNTFYIISGRDEAPRDSTDFRMMSWQLFVTKDPASHDWRVYPDFLRPEKIFGWATPDGAWAPQIVQGPDRRFYFYAPVRERNCKARDCFGIGVAAASSPLGPWQDIHPEGPIISQTTPVRNNIENIDPTMLVDDDGRVYIYWGTFGNLRGIELEKDMKTPKGTEVTVTTLTGFFEAAWLFKRKGVYYMAYAANNAGPNSPCTEAVYHACQAYGTAPTPLGPWTYRGVFLDPVSSTTSHMGLVPFKDKWYIAYHTGDAKGGGHFRRSVAVDEVLWDDTVSPPVIRKVVQTHAPVDPTPTHNMALIARITASNMPLPVQFRLRALNDGRIPPAPLPPDMWGNWTGRNDVKQGWILYQWDKPVKLDAARIYFWGDHPAGSGEGVAPPRAWRVEYWDENRWKAVNTAQDYAVVDNDYSQVQFEPVTTRCVKAVLDASTDGKAYAAFGVLEWQMLSPDKIVPPATTPKAYASPTCAK